MKVLIDDRCLDAVRTYSERAYPTECCGFLVGEMNGDGVRVVRLVAPAVNEAAEHGLADRYHIAPRDYLRIDREARARGWDILGVYHSHPDVPASPSRTDLALGWPNYVYLIVPVNGGAAGDATAWVLDERAPGYGPSFERIDVETLSDAPA